MFIRTATISAIVPEAASIHPLKEAYWKCRRGGGDGAKAQLDFDSLEPRNQAGTKCTAEIKLCFSEIHNVHGEAYLLLAVTFTQGMPNWIGAFIAGEVYEEVDLMEVGVALIALPFRPGQRVEGKILFPQGQGVPAPGEVPTTLPPHMAAEIARRGIAA